MEPNVPMGIVAHGLQGPGAGTRNMTKKDVPKRTPELVSEMPKKHTPKRPQNQRSKNMNFSIFSNFFKLEKLLHKTNMKNIFFQFFSNLKKIEK